MKATESKKSSKRKGNGNDNILSKPKRPTSACEFNVANQYMQHHCFGNTLDLTNTAFRQLLFPGPARGTQAWILSE